jgi:hypothetical protein
VLLDHLALGSRGEIEHIHWSRWAERQQPIPLRGWPMASPTKP